jgi:hypothetical protein
MQVKMKLLFILHHTSLQFTIVGATNKTQQTTKICYINQTNTTCKQRKTQNIDMYTNKKHIRKKTIKIKIKS